MTGAGSVKPHGVSEYGGIVGVCEGENVTYIKEGSSDNGSKAFESTPQQGPDKDKQIVCGWCTKKVSSSGG